MTQRGYKDIPRLFKISAILLRLFLSFQPTRTKGFVKVDTTRVELVSNHKFSSSTNKLFISLSLHHTVQQDKEKSYLKAQQRKTRIMNHDS
jgi:hypothetical protein